jgi:hypothetical protein
MLKADELTIKQCEQIGRYIKTTDFDTFKELAIQIETKKLSNVGHFLAYIDPEMAEQILENN